MLKLNAMLTPLIDPRNTKRFRILDGRMNMTITEKNNAKLTPLVLVLVFEIRRAG